MTKRQRQQQKPNPDLLARLFSDMSLAGRLVFDRRVAGTAKLIPLAIIAYIISPIDLVPDLLLPFGVVDDLTAFLLGLQMFIRSAPPDVVREYREGKRQGHYDEVPHRHDPPPQGQIIEGDYEIRDDGPRT